MMRDYKFRAKRKDNGEWVKGDLIRSRIAVEAWINTHNLVTRKGEFIQPVPVDPSTVGQYTGLPDKNGVEVYEGDILQDPDDRIFTVAWNRGAASFELRSRASYCLFVQRYIDLLQVIGNIYDNPELLKEGEQ
jgi:uncharacterized phage protein (TIGR01671 family)